MHQNRFRLHGALPQTSLGGAYSAPPDPLAVFKGPTSKGKEREGEEVREREWGGKEVEGENDLTHPLSQLPGYVTGQFTD